MWSNVAKVSLLIDNPGLELRLSQWGYCLQSTEETHLVHLSNSHSVHCCHWYCSAVVICKMIIKVHPRKCKGHGRVSMWGASNSKDSPGVLGPWIKRWSRFHQRPQWEENGAGKLRQRLSWRKGAHVSQSMGNMSTTGRHTPGLGPLETRKTPNPTQGGAQVQNALLKLGRVGRGRLRWPGQLRVTGVAVQPLSVWDRSVLAECKPCPRLPLTSDSSLVKTPGKLIFGNDPASLSLRLWRVTSHPLIITLVLKQLFSLFYLRLVAHAPRLVSSPPPPDLCSHGSRSSWLLSGAPASGWLGSRAMSAGPQLRN